MHVRHTCVAPVHPWAGPVLCMQSPRLMRKGACGRTLLHGLRIFVCLMTSFIEKRGKLGMGFPEQDRPDAPLWASISTGKCKSPMSVQD